MKECRRILKSGVKFLIADWRRDDIEQGGPPKEHRIEASVALSHLEIAGFKDILEFNASRRLFCISAANP